jgi:hypothetical protein
MEKHVSHVECPYCHSHLGWRAPVTQSVEVTVDADFRVIEIGPDVSDPEVEKERVYCSYCGFEPSIDRGTSTLKAPASVGDQV